MMTKRIVLLAIAVTLVAMAAHAACTFPDLLQLTPVASGHHSFRVGIGDVNRDGIVDIATTDSAASDIRVRLGNGNGTFQAHVSYAVTSPTIPYIADVNNDQWGDLVFITNGTSLGVMLNSGNGSFGIPATFNFAFNSVDNFESGDMDNDGDVDLVVWDLGGAHVLSNNGTGAFASKTTVYPGITDGVSVVDLNNDGRLDLAIAAWAFNAPGSLRIHLNSASGFTSIATRAYTLSNTNSTAIATGDFNNDGRADVAITFWNGFATYLGTGSHFGTFTTGMSMTLNGYGVDFSDVTVGDFNEDGDADMAFASANGNMQYVAVGLGDGNFRNPLVATRVATSHVNEIESADFDRDGRMDFAGFETDRNELQIFRNVCPLRRATASVSTSGNPAVYGSAVTFSATVTGAAGSPVATGTVSLYVDDVLRETRDLNNGAATFTAIANLAAGYHGVRVEYPGNVNFDAASSSILSQEITRPPFGPPVEFRAFRFSANAIHFRFIGVQDAVKYQFFRWTNGSWQFVSENSAPYEDGSDLMVPDSTPQIYAVRAVRQYGEPSAMSNPDVATTHTYATPTLQGAVIRAIDVVELRTLIDAFRAKAGLSAFPFTDASLSGVQVKAQHVMELRTAVNAARTTFGMPAGSYTYPALTPGVTPVRAADLQDLRDKIY